MPELPWPAMVSDRLDRLKVRVTIDGEVCSGHGRCYDVAPSLFEDDERGYGCVKDDGTVGADQVGDAEAAVKACPERAVHIVD